MRAASLSSSRAIVATSSEQAAEFAATDWQRLLMLAPLVDAYFTKPDRFLMGDTLTAPPARRSTRVRTAAIARPSFAVSTTPSRALFLTLSVTTSRTADSTNATVASVAMSVRVTKRGGVRRGMGYFDNRQRELDARILAGDDLQGLCRLADALVPRAQLIGAGWHRVDGKRAVGDRCRIQAVIEDQNRRCHLRMDVCSTLITPACENTRSRFSPFRAGPDRRSARATAKTL